MEEMNYLGSNIRYLRKQASLTQANFADEIGVNRSVVGAYEEGRAEPRLKTLQRISEFFSISLDALLNASLEQGGVPQKKDLSGEQLRILPVTVTEDGEREMVPLIPVKAAAGYLAGYGDSEYIKGLPQFNLPYPELARERTYRIFQIEGDSMLPIPSGSYVICEYVSDWRQIRDDQCYVLLTESEGVVFKRVENYLEDKGILYLKSDNPAYQPYAVPAEQITEVWSARGFTAFQLPEGANEEVNLQQLALTVAQLQKEVNLLKARGK